MKEAVEYLGNMDETYQHCGASFIQHNTFIDDKAKEEVLVLLLLCHSLSQRGYFENGPFHSVPADKGEHSLIVF